MIPKQDFNTKTLTPEQCKDKVNEFHKTFPEISAWLKKVKDKYVDETFFVYLDDDRGNWNWISFFLHMKNGVPHWESHPKLVTEVDASVYQAAIINWLVETGFSDQAPSIKIKSLKEITPPEGFDDAFPFDLEHIPDEGRDVIQIDRFGRETEYFTGFLRKEMLNGRFLGYNPEYVRWLYTDTP